MGSPQFGSRGALGPGGRGLALSPGCAGTRPPWKGPEDSNRACGDNPFEPRVFGFINFAHAAHAEAPEETVVSELLAHYSPCLWRKCGLLGQPCGRLTFRSLCVMMLNMKTATVRQVQHSLSEVLKWVDTGEEVLVTRRGRLVARLVPAREATQKPEWPDFLARSSQIWGKQARGRPVSRMIVEERGERG